MVKLQHLDLESESFYAGMLYPFVEDGQLMLFVLHAKNKYDKNKVNIKMPGGSGDKRYAKGDAYEKKLEETLEALKFDRIARLKILNQEYDRRAKHADHPNAKRALWILQTLTLECLEATGYYPADVDPWIADVVEKSEEHVQYFFEIKEIWDKEANVIATPEPDDEFEPIDENVVVPRDKIDMLDFEEMLADSHKRPVEFYLEHLREKALKARKS